MLLNAIMVRLAQYKTGEDYAKTTRLIFLKLYCNIKSNT